MAHKDNPYCDKEGNALIEKLPQFLAFEREKELERRKDLPAHERADLEASDRNLSQKMNS